MATVEFGNVRKRTKEEEREAKFKAFWNGFSHPFLYEESADYDDNEFTLTYVGALTRVIISGACIGAALAGVEWHNLDKKGLVAVCQPDGTWDSRDFKVIPDTWVSVPKKKKN